MKYAFFILSLSIHLIHSPLGFAQDHKISSFKDSQALMTIAQFMSDNGEDFSVSFRLSDNKLKLTNQEICTIVEPRAVLKHVEVALMTLLRRFPDEELPIEDAMSDLTTYLGTSLLKKCTLTKSAQQKEINSAYYFDPSENIHVKIDTVTLKEL